MTPDAQRHLDQLDAETIALLDELAAHSEAALNTPPRPDAWTAVQTMHHLLLSEALSLAYLRKKLSFDPTLPSAGWLEKAREWFLTLFYKTGIKRRAPAIIAGDQLPDTATLADTKAEWLAMRQDFRRYLSGLDRSLFDKSVFKHPVVGRMTLEGMLYFHLVHFRHHRKQIRAAANPQTA